MNAIDLTPIYRNSVGFDRLAQLFDSALRSDSSAGNYPPYNIESLGENRYAISLAVAGFTEPELDIKVERGTLTVRGKKADDKERKFLYQGIANRTFERSFSLADHVEVVDAQLVNGLLTIALVKELPEAMKPRAIAINSGRNKAALEHKADKQQEAA